MSQSEHGQESLGADEPLIEEAFQESEGAAASCPETLLLFASGLLSALGGVYLAVTSNSWGSLGAINQRLAEMGLTAGPLLMGGLVLLGLGMSARAQAQRAAASGQEPEGELVLDQLATDLVRVRSALGKLDQRFVGLARATQALGERIREQKQSSAGGAPAQEPEGQSDALWRIAASLDQLGAHLDRQLSERVQALEDRVLFKLENMQSPSAELGASAPAPEEQPSATPEAQLASAPAPAEQVLPDPAAELEFAGEAPTQELPALLSDLDDIDFLQEAPEHGPVATAFDEPEAALPVDPAPAAQDPADLVGSIEPDEEQPEEASDSSESEASGSGPFAGFELDLDL